MPDSVTIARPYAKAIFEHALSLQKLGQWSGYLSGLASAMLDNNASDFIANPVTDANQHVDLLMSVIGKVTEDNLVQLKNLVQTLAENKRLAVLPDILVLFEDLRAQQEKTLTVDVLSYDKLSDFQQKELITILSKRLQRQVTLNLSIDKDLIGGAVIKAGDLVIDGSVRGKLNKLSIGLVA